jgi:hypothetical protein
MRTAYTQFRKTVTFYWQLIYFCSFVPPQLEFMTPPAVLTYFFSLPFYNHKNETATNPKNGNIDPGYKRKS